MILYKNKKWFHKKDFKSMDKVVVSHEKWKFVQKPWNPAFCNQKKGANSGVKLSCRQETHVSFPKKPIIPLLNSRSLSPHLPSLLSIHTPHLIYLYTSNFTAFYSSETLLWSPPRRWSHLSSDHTFSGIVSSPVD